MEEQNRNIIFAYASKLEEELGELRLNGNDNGVTALVERAVTIGHVAILNWDSLDSAEIIQIKNLLVSCDDIFTPGGFSKVGNFSSELSGSLYNIEQSLRKKKLLLDRDSDFIKAA